MLTGWIIGCPKRINANGKSFRQITIRIITVGGFGWFGDWLIGKNVNCRFDYFAKSSDMLTKVDVLMAIKHQFQLVAHLIQ